MAALVLCLIGLLAVVMVPKPRHRVTTTVRTWIAQGWSVIRTLTVRRVVWLMGGNLMDEVLFALTFALFCSAFSQPVPIPTLLVINVVTSLFAGLMPVPGGIGVSEAALVAGLTAAGVPSGPAFAIVITYRLATFYLPPIWGAVAYRWLERNRYL